VKAPASGAKRRRQRPRTRRLSAWAPVAPERQTGCRPLHGPRSASGLESLPDNSYRACASRKLAKPSTPGSPCQEGTDGYLARQPLLGVIVQDRRPGHHPRHNRRRLQMHQHVATRRNPHCFVAGHAVLTGNRLRGRERRGFAGVVGSHCGRNTSMTGASSASGGPWLTAPRRLSPLEVPYEQTRQIDLRWKAVVFSGAGEMLAPAEQQVCAGRGPAARRQGSIRSIAGSPFLMATAVEARSSTGGEVVEGSATLICSSARLVRMT
jgi:hypothetical protein